MYILIELNMVFIKCNLYCVNSSEIKFESLLRVELMKAGKEGELYRSYYLGVNPLIITPVVILKR